MFLEAALILLLIGHLLLIYACYDLRQDRSKSKDDWGLKWSAITELLEELLDAIDDFGGGSPSQGPNLTGGGIQDILTGLIMNRIQEGLTHGEEEPTRSISEGETEKVTQE